MNIPAVQINCKLKSEFPQERLCPPNKEGLPGKIPNFCRKRHNGVEMEKHSCEECVSGFQRIRLQTPVIAVNYFLATTMTFLKNRNSTLKWNVAKQFQLTVEWLVSCPEKLIIRKRSGVLLLKNLSRSYPVEVDTINFLIFEPLSIHCIGHTRREGNGWFWDQASILGNRATST